MWYMWAFQISNYSMSWSERNTRFQMFHLFQSHVSYTWNFRDLEKCLQPTSWAVRCYTWKPKSSFSQQAIILCPEAWDLITPIIILACIDTDVINGCSLSNPFLKRSCSIWLGDLLWIPLVDSVLHKTRGVWGREKRGGGLFCFGGFFFFFESDFPK